MTLLTRENLLEIEKAMQEVVDEIETNVCEEAISPFTEEFPFLKIEKLKHLWEKEKNKYNWKLPPNPVILDYDEKFITLYWGDFKEKLFFINHTSLVNLFNENATEKVSEQLRGDLLAAHIKHPIYTSYGRWVLHPFQEKVFAIVYFFEH